MSWFYAFVRTTGGGVVEPELPEPNVLLDTTGLALTDTAGNDLLDTTGAPVALFSAGTSAGMDVEDLILMEWEEAMLRVEAKRYAAAVKPLGRVAETKQEFATALHDAARPLVRIVRRRGARIVHRVDEIVSEALAREGIDPEGKLGKFARERVRWMLRMSYGDVANRMKAA